MTTACHILDCDLPADIADDSLDLCARHYRKLTAIVPEPDPHMWPAITAATLLAQLEATRKADQESRDRRAFGGGEK